MSPLPAGTVTFLFTDIEGSTRLWPWTRCAASTWRWRSQRPRRG